MKAWLPKLLGLCLMAASFPPVWANTPPVQTTSEKVRFDFRDTSILQIIRLLSEISNTNIIATEKAGAQKISIFLQDMPIPSVLDAICKTAGLWYRKDENTGVWRVMTLEEYQRDIVVYREEQMRVFTMRNSNVISSANAIAALFGSRVKLSAGVEESVARGAAGAASAAASAGGGGTSSVNTSTNTSKEALTANQVATNLSKMPGDLTQREEKLASSLIQPPSIFVTYNRLHNLLIVRSADADALKEISRLISEIDRPTRQVLLEMKVLEVTLGDTYRSVFDIGLLGGGYRGAPALGHPANPVSPEAPGQNIILGLGNNALEGGSLIFQLMNNRVLSRIQMMATQNKVNVLSSPTLLASNNQLSKLFVGEERIMTTGVTANTVTNENSSKTTYTVETEKRNIGNTLQILPRINADGTITLSILQDLSSILVQSTSIPVSSDRGVQSFPIDTVSTANLDVMVIAKDRQSVAVGGMIRESVSDAENKVPFLGNLPILGSLFKRTEKSNIRSELVLVITPYIVDSPEQGSSISQLSIGGNSTHPSSPYVSVEEKSIPAKK